MSTSEGLTLKPASFELASLEPILALVGRWAMPVEQLRENLMKDTTERISSTLVKVQ
jgi:hypothetical protein